MDIHGIMRAPSNSMLMWDMGYASNHTTGKWEALDCGGDFNELISGRDFEARKQMQNFWSTLDDCHLQDFGFSGNCFTWCNGMEGTDNIGKRLDWFTTNKEWKPLYPNWWVAHLLAPYSDHSPIIIHTGNESIRTKRHRPFHFKVMWVGNEECKKVIYLSLGVIMMQEIVCL